MRAEQDETTPIPVILNLSTWAQKPRSIGDWMIDELRLRYDVPTSVGAAWSQTGQLLPLLDGLDEIPAELRSACVAALNDYSQEHEELAGLVVCCRQDDYAALPQRLRVEAAILLKQLTAEQIECWLAQSGIPPASFSSLLESDPAMLDLARCPLFLDILTRMLCNTGDFIIRDCPDISGRYKDLLNAYVINVMRRRPIRVIYSPASTLEYLSLLAKRLIQLNLSALHLEELQIDLLKNPAMRWLVNYASVFFMLFGISLFTVCILLVFQCIKPSSFFDFDVFPAWLLFVLITVMSLCSTIFTLRDDPGDQIMPLYGIRWSRQKFQSNWRQAAKQGLYKGLVRNLILSMFATGVALIVISKPDIWRSMGIERPPLQLFQYCLFFVLFMLVYYISFLLMILPAQIMFEIIKISIYTDKVPAKNVPNQGMQNSLHRVLFLGAFQCIWMSIVSFIPRPLPENGGSLFYNAIAMLALAGPVLLYQVMAYLGGVVVARHYMLRLLLAVNGLLPLRLIRFLDCASDCMLLRRAGGGYIFAHRVLAEFFAKLSLAEAQALSKALSRNHE